MEKDEGFLKELFADMEKIFILSSPIAKEKEPRETKGILWLISPIKGE
jgi:hypothetical protein